MQPPIPVPILINLQCGHCKKFVTCGPVHVTPNSSILCGRCYRLAKREYRNLAFEAVASIYRYPCYYWPKHCAKKLAWNESYDHEKNCLFQSSCSVFCSRPGTFFKSDRKLPNNQELNLEHVPDQVLEVLKCVACESYLSNAPVFVVNDGKNICHRCNHSNGIPKGAIRNLAYETIASSLIFPCIYRFRGCTVRLKFGRDMWAHETECPYGQVKRISKKPSTKVVGKDGKEKERGVIETHSGHIWGTITPHSALFAPPKSKNNDGKIVTQELTEIMKKKQKEEEPKNFDTQSVDSMVSKASTFDSLGDNLSRDNISRSTVDNISRDNVSRSTVDNISREDVSRGSSRAQMHDDFRPPVTNYHREQPRPSSYDVPRQMYQIPRQGASESYGPNYPQNFENVAPLPTPTGFNKPPFNGYHSEDMAKYGRPSNFEQYPHLYHFPPIYFDSNANLNYSSSFNNYPSPHPSHVLPKRSESFRVGNQDLIDELKLIQNKKNSTTTSPSAPKENNPYGQCNNLQEIVQKHDEVFN